MLHFLYPKENNILLLLRSTYTKQLYWNKSLYMITWINIFINKKLYQSPYYDTLKRSCVERFYYGRTVKTNTF